MTAQLDARAKELFLSAARLAPAERDAFLDRSCGDDAGLRAQVAALLEPAAPTGGLLRDVLEEPGDAVPGAKLDGDRYRLIRSLGEGGMGRVFLAERSDGEFRQQVAIKLLAWFLGEDPAAVLRFRAERQILARLSHPNIARLLDGGTTPRGQPYLVMEYVQGEPVDRFVARRALGVEARLRLFLKVCDAVRVAHQNLVVHRDLKPANILVTEAGEPKLLDFGIAKLLDPELAEEGAQTRRGETLLTPRYASPEQVRAEAITTASDVYSLGVVLYELLTGVLPYRRSSLAAPGDLLRAICEQVPTPPSLSPAARPSSGRQPEDLLGGTPASAAPAPAKLGRDLDAIVLKALRKEPEQRYFSVEALAEDLRRYLEGRPVEARKGGGAYRVARFARRHRWALAAAALFLAVILGFTWGLSRELRRTAAERDKARRVTEFLVKLFEQSDPNEARGSTVTVRTALDRGAARVERQLAATPDVQATLLESVGRVYHNLGLYSRGRELLSRAVELRRRESAPGDLAGTLVHLSISDRVTGDLAAAEKSLAEARLLAERAGNQRLGFEVAMQSADLAQARGALQESERLFRELLARYGESGVASELDLANVYVSLASVRQRLGNESGARGEIEAAEAHLARAGDSDPLRAAGIVVYLAQSWRDIGEPVRAMQLLEPRVADLRRLLPGDHAELANALNSLAILHADQGDLAQAAVAWEQSGAMWRRLMGDDHPDTALAVSNLGVLYLRRGDWRRAEQLLTESLTANRKALPPGHPTIAINLENLADALLELGDWPRAARLLDESQTIVDRQMPKPSPAQGRLLGRRARHLERLGQAARGEPLVRRSVEIYRATSPPGSPAFAPALVNHGRLLLALGQQAEARLVLEEAVATRVRVLGEKHYEVALAKSLLGEALAASEPKRARTLLEEALRVQAQALLPAHPVLAETRLRLAAVLRDAGEGQQARKLLEQAAEDLRAAFPHGHPVLARVASALALVR